ncbi:MAG: 3-hydroxyacyl-CoA dehydrogenase NAD-binding domain-containing protein, partial [Planctomycetota bacterium]
MTDAWTLHVDEDRIAWLTFDEPGSSVNTFNERTLRELDALLAGPAAAPNLRAVVITSDKPTCFIAGADLDELTAIEHEDDAWAKAQAGHAVFDRLEALPAPTVAVVHGACLGGGLELALACDYRLVSDHPSTKLGLPEVKLGIIPGWGGTRRLPRLVGLIAALDLILTGRSVSARTARRLGLADGGVAAAFLREQTRAFLEQVWADGGRRVRRRRRRARGLAGRIAGRWPLRLLAFRRARRQITKRTSGHYPAPLAALDVLRESAVRREPQACAEAEIEAFSRLACTSISRHLVWLFQSGQRLRRKRRDGGERDEMRNAAVVGAGIMGGGIAWALSRAGMQVRLKDVSWEAAARGTAAAAGILRGQVKRRRLTPAGMSLAMHRIAPCVEYGGFGRVDVVIEAVVEDLDIKRQVLRDIEAAVPRDAIIATNTSSLPLADLAGALEHPGRFVGLHFFNPVHRMPLVEVVPGRDTTPETLARATELVRRLDKTPLVVGDCPGFLVNRILLPYLVESAWMCEEGVAPTRIDELLEEFGMPMGPLALVDEVGLDVGYKVARQLEEAYGPRMHVPPGLGTVAAGAALGRKTGRGFYVYR